MRCHREIKICILPKPEITGSRTMILPILWEDSQTNLSETSVVFRIDLISWKGGTKVKYDSRTGVWKGKLLVMGKDCTTAELL